MTFRVQNRVQLCQVHACLLKLFYHLIFPISKNLPFVQPAFSYCSQKSFFNHAENLSRTAPKSQLKNIIFTIKQIHQARIDE